MDLRLNQAESEALDELAGLLRRSRVDSCREAIWGYLRKVRVTGGELTERRVVYARDGNTVTTDPTAGPVVAEVPARVVDDGFFDDESREPPRGRKRPADD